MRNVQYQIQGTRRELGNALDLLLRAVYVYTYEIGLWYPKTAASSVDQNLKRLRTDGHVNGILRSVIDRPQWPTALAFRKLSASAGTQLEGNG